MRHLDLNLALEYLSLNQITGQTDGKYLQYLTVFTHEITGTSCGTSGNIADLGEKGTVLTWRPGDVGEFESLRGKKTTTSPGASYLQPHLLRIV